MTDLTPDLRSMPAEVLEAAAEALYEVDEVVLDPERWGREPESVKHPYRMAIRDAYPAIAAWVTAQVSANPRDEYHTMAELYDYRMLYNALAANAMPGRAVKSWKHSDGEPCFGGGWFVVYLDLPTGQVSNHYRAEHWDLFKIPAVGVAPKWDGHTPEIAAERLREYLQASHRGGVRP